MADSNEMLTDQELVAKGWSADYLRREIVAGRLQGFLQGTGFVTSLAWVEEWRVNNRGGKTSPVARAAPRASAAALGAAAEWNGRLARLEAAGTPRATAISMIDEAYPGLRQRMIAETNTAVHSRHKASMSQATAERLARNPV